MARRKFPVGLAMGLTVAIVLVFGLGFLFLSRTGGGIVRTVPPLDVAAYLDNANSLSGNAYRLDATILNSLAWDPAKGRLISVTPDDASPSPLAVFVPASLAQVNLQKGQRYHIAVAVTDHGILKVTALQKE